MRLAVSDPVSPPVALQPGGGRQSVRPTPRCYVPGYTFARLAVSKAWQGRGLGEALLMNALERVPMWPAGQVGGYAFFVDAKDAGTAVFYAYFGLGSVDTLPADCPTSRRCDALLAAPC